MQLEEKKIEDAFESAYYDIHREISRHNISVRIKAIQFLLPDTHKLEEDLLQRFLYCADETREDFIKAVEDFVFNGQESTKDSEREIERSLYYFSFRDPFKYKCYKESSLKHKVQNAFRSISSFKRSPLPNAPANKIHSNNPNKLRLTRDPIPTTGIDKEKLTSRKNLDIFWGAWNNALEKYNYGHSSLWTYITIRREDGEPFISSAFVVFDGCLESAKKTHKLQSITNKRIQDALYRLTLDLFNLEIYRQATRAAISQVMARNMSHNIGSHVLSRMEAPSGDQYQGFSLNDKSTDSPQKLDAIFNSYLKSRMDFLADVTTGVPTIENSKWFFKELLSGIDKNRLLLNRISGIGNFHYRIKARNFIDDESGVEIDDKDNDLMVSIPNDVLGCHAFYTILENIIRNCAKHGGKGDKGKSSENPLNICIDVRECSEPEANELYEITIYDDGEDSESSERVTISEEEKKKYEEYLPPKQNGKILMTRLDKLVLDQNYRINQSVLKEGTLRQGAWGLIEMDASAAYLRKIPVEQIDEDYYEIDLKQSSKSKKSYFSTKKNSEYINILKAVAVDEKFLGYRLFIYKPREILIIDDTDTYKYIDNIDRKKLLKSGILICDYTNTESEFAYDSKRVYNHKLVILLSDRPDEIIKTNATGITERILKISSNNIEDKLLLNPHSLSHIEEFKEYAWNYYLKNRNYDYYQNYAALADVEYPILKQIGNTASNLKVSFFDHGFGYKSDQIDGYKSDSSAHFKEIIYSAVKGFMPDHDEIKVIQFVDSIHNRIVIVDERIQEYAEYATYPVEREEINISHIYKSTNIYVPAKSECNLGEQNFDDQYPKILDVFSKQKNATFFVIHLGVIEKLIESVNRKKVPSQSYDKDKDIRKFLEEVICKDNGIEYNKLIIISGRGMPHNLPADTRYLNYSIISQYMIDLRFKYLLSEAVFSARRIK